MLVHLLRHGEAEGGMRYWGRTDVDLSPEGWQQMRTAERLRLFWSDPGVHTPPGGESLADLHARVIAVCQRLVNPVDLRRMSTATDSGAARSLPSLEHR